jgi:hypothetical protein
MISYVKYGIQDTTMPPDLLVLILKTIPLYLYYQELFCLRSLPPVNLLMFTLG